MSTHSTCMISSLPIRNGEKVAVFILEQRVRTRWSRCEPDSLYYSSAFPIYAEYDDYGLFKNAHGFGSDIYLKALEKASLRDWWGDPSVRQEFDRKTGETSFVENQLIAPLTWNQIQEYTKEGTLVMEREGELSRVIPVFVKRDLFDQILREYTTIGSGQETSFAQYCENIHQVASDIIEAWNSEAAYHRQWYPDKEPTHGFGNILPHLYKMVKKGKKTIKEDIGLDLIKYRIFNNGSNGNSVFELQDHLKDIFRHTPDDKWQPTLELHLLEILKGIWIDHFLNDVRRPWSPTTSEAHYFEPRKNFQLLHDFCGEEADRLWKDDEL